jgi:hypothetical protein
MNGKKYPHAVRSALVSLMLSGRLHIYIQRLAQHVKAPKPAPGR